MNTSACNICSQESSLLIFRLLTFSRFSLAGNQAALLWVVRCRARHRKRFRLQLPCSETFIDHLGDSFVLEDLQTNSLLLTTRSVPHFHQPGLDESHQRFRRHLLCDVGLFCCRRAYLQRNMREQRYGRL